MTEYGRGSGSQPWHPEDPLYGDPGWDGSPATGQQQEGWDTYAGEQYPQQYPQQQYQDQQYSQQYPQQHAPQQQYGDQYYPHPQQYPQGQQPPYGGDSYGGDPYGGEGWDTGGQQQYPDPQQHQAPYPHPQQAHPQQHQHPQQQNQAGQYGGQGWDTQGGQQYGGGAPDPYGGGVPDAYGMRPADPYDTGQNPAQAVQHGYHADEGGYPQPGPHQQYEQPEMYGPSGDPGGHRPEPDPETGWDPGADQGEHAFFTDRDDDAVDDYDDDDPSGRDGRRNGRSRDGDTKRRGGCACLVAALVLTGGVGTVGYFGYQFYESRFGPAPDFSGEGKGTVQVEVPKGSSLSDMGNTLKKAGVVKSHDAFVDAAESNTKSSGIQAGVYTMRKEMSADAAVKLMLDPASQSGLIIPEGLRASQVYALIDKTLQTDKGAAEKAAEAGGLGLPEWAEDNPEGFLFPAKYTVSEKTTPKELLSAMVKRAESEFRKLGLEEAAEEAGKSPEEILSIASLIQAEAQDDGDFGKVSRVIYNRLDQDMKLQFDSTINYAKGESKLNTTVNDTKFESPYNTYLHKGLPPGPIDNPGNLALETALEPTKGDWLYFVSVKPGDTRFTDSHDEHERNVQDFNEYSRKNGKDD
ncbi:endolytic transglycosylase MltG [Streptomyces sp. N2-109]|uniref:Endolytic murein transglycosylase n=1 Tax=Streptomyces gossypii TaxID=2883101 RepID=A0ABT2JL08_9ACTN|nr:endolytic transglycosylase MltG [Streptomyces gossypii]MCT2588560.1 endolytic transglycosylase MltG [Streptomyces gossypii]